MKNFLDISFPDMDKVLKGMEKTKGRLEKEIEKAVYKTTLFGIAVIAKDCPVDTGRARASIGGEYLSKAGVNPRKGIKKNSYDPAAISDGKNKSLTKIDGLQSVIGSNVEYITFIEYGHKVPKRLTKKQLAYLFASGKLDKDKYNFYKVNKKINDRAGKTSKVKGKGMFRKNKPKIQDYFYDQMEAIVKRAIRDGGR